MTSTREQTKGYRERQPDRRMAIEIGGCLLLGLVDDDVVRQGHLAAHLALRVVREHDLDADAEHALAHHHVAAGLVEVFICCSTSMCMLLYLFMYMCLDKLYLFMYMCCTMFMFLCTV